MHRTSQYSSIDVFKDTAFAHGCCRGASVAKDILRLTRAGGKCRGKRRPRSAADVMYPWAMGKQYECSTVTFPTNGCVSASATKAFASEYSLIRRGDSRGKRGGGGGEIPSLFGYGTRGKGTRFPRQTVGAHGSLLLVHLCKVTSNGRDDEGLFYVQVLH